MSTPTKPPARPEAVAVVIDLLVETMAGMAYYNSGQDCTAPCRLVVGPKIYDDVVTGMTDGFIEGERFESHVKPRIPAGRFGAPEDFGGIAVYLASDASAWHTGDTITIDGGYLQF